MSDNTGIQWTDATWNPIRGCSRVSEGCRNCYAEAVAARFSGPGQPYYGLARRTSSGKPRWTGKIMFVEKHLPDPLRWKRPRRIFVNSMSDLFHEEVTNEQLYQIFAVMMLARQHTFQILTKRPERMRAFLNGELERTLNAVGDSIWFAARDLVEAFPKYDDELLAHSEHPVWPLENVWCGVSVENQAAADLRIPLLAQTPAAIRFLSCEPLLGPIDFYGAGSRGPEEGDPEAFSALSGYDGTDPTIPGIDWVIVGGESGPGARSCNVQWIRDIAQDCRRASVAVFVKQLGAEPGFRLEDEERRGNPMPSFHHSDGDLFIKKLDDSHGGNPAEWPEELRIREFPREAALV